jgi:putative transcription antitermination factor YqgF
LSISKSNNFLSIDYGTKNIGLAISISAVISPLSVIKNDQNCIKNIQSVIDEYDISKVFVGISIGTFAKKTLVFVDQLSAVLECSIETVEESVSTIEATRIFFDNRGKKKDYKSKIDAISASVILRRALS